MLWDRNPKNWKLSVFYYNPEEPRLWVAKRFGTPIALNFARPMAWAITGGTIAIWVGLAALASIHSVR